MMLYVHRPMGDAQPGEVAANVLGPAVNGTYNQIATAAALRRPVHDHGLIRRQISRLPVRAATLSADERGRGT